MKNRITFFALQGLAASVVAFLGQNASAQTVSTLYDNSTTTQTGNYVVGNEEAGNEIVLAGAGPSFEVTSFAFQFFFTGSGTPSGSPSLTLNFYANNGGTFNGFTEPGTSLYSSSFSLSSFTGTSPSIGTGQATLTFAPDVVVPRDFTWTVSFSGVSAAELAGLSIFNGAAGTGGTPVPNVGFNYNDAWVNSGSAGSPSWSLVKATSPNPPLQFAANASGVSVPEPSTIALGVIGACGFLARRRKS